MEGFKEFSPQDLAAQTIQCAYRQHLARVEHNKRVREKQDYEEAMDRLQREAFVAMVKREQEIAERERQKEEMERQRKREEQECKTRMLEGAFEGDLDEILAVLKEVADRDSKDRVPFDEIGRVVRQRHEMGMVECTDAHGNTPLSEAAGGGHPPLIRFLIEKGANPNSKGGYGRTPLYRAAFSGHLAAVEILLQLGADPRIYADDGNRPEEVGSTDSVINVLQGWDLTTTDTMLHKMEAVKEKRLQMEQQQRQKEAAKLQDQVSELTKEAVRSQKEMHKAYAELNKRMNEHDKCERDNMGKTAITLQAIHDAEAVLEVARATATTTQEKLSVAKMELREKQQEDSSSLPMKGINCNIRELDDVLLKDVGNKIRNDGRWPLIIDPSGQAAVFLRYLDTNYVNALNPNQMQPSVLRINLLGAIRFGKMLVIDMMEVNLMEVVTRMMEQIQTALMDELLNKQLLQNDRYLSLIRAGDGPEYSPMEFSPVRAEKFKFLLITKVQNLPDEMLSTFYPIHIVINNSGR
ncbi:IQ motif and ankyrin repeat domain-containing protein 1 [Callorhinchus milii]|uniref:IQ motif and ankyrin repeat domain-containing protein 1 n=1 Tax=Callorhinchus milii TaxID=7868 RepID=UPI00045761F2|nr:IQ motif and ankyrin repeat domain-containing protein 1 [Callorhinchus milii]|eukprot:gi/632955147/ref/XP_007893326.1/ PREDICTED: putative IQ motif and ankyrin repeat domain-containing protein [Callorhinchus milii]